jgi:hypothetical protein
MASASGMETQEMATLKSALRAKFDQRIASSFCPATLRTLFDRVAQGSKPKTTG